MENVKNIMVGKIFLAAQSCVNGSTISPLKKLLT
jgi:hypothetical protein